MVLVRHQMGFTIVSGYCLRIHTFYGSKIIFKISRCLGGKPDGKRMGTA